MWEENVDSLSCSYESSRRLVGFVSGGCWCIIEGLDRVCIVEQFDDRLGRLRLMFLI